MSEEVFEWVLARIDDDKVNKDLTEKEVYSIAQTLLKDRCCLCGIARSRQPLFEVYDGQVCSGCVKSIQERGR